MGLNRRFLIPCLDATPATAYYATLGDADDERQERGPAPGIVVRDVDNKGGAELAMVRRARVPITRHLSGEVRIHISGDLAQGRMLWRRDGDPYWKGKSDYTDLAQSICVRQSTTAFMQHPKLLTMSNGELLIVWAEHASSNTDENNWNWKARILDPRTYALGAIITFPSVTSGGVSANRGATVAGVPGIDVAEDPVHPGRIVAVGLADVENLSASGTNVDAVTFTSADYGRSWKIQAITQAIGADNSYGVTIEYVGARIAMLFGNASTGIAAWYSNDNGTTWSAGTVDNQPANRSGHVDMIQCINGALVAALASSESASTMADQFYWSGDGGATWTRFTDASGAVSSARSPALMVDDQGFPGLYSLKNVTAGAKGLANLRTGVRAITLTEVQKATNIFDDGQHQVDENCVIDDFTSATANLSLERIAATNWRGRAAVCLYYNDTSRRSLSLHFPGMWSDLRYSTLHGGFSVSPSADGIASWFWMYLPLDLPDTLGTTGYAWTAAGTTSGNFISEGGGLVMVDSGAAQDRYTSPTLVVDPHVTRIVCRCLQGGSTTADTVMYQVANGGSETRYGIRLATTGFQVRDVSGAANIGAAIAADMTQWHEFVFVTFGANFRQLYWRKLDPDNDGEHVRTNELLSSSVALNTGTAEATSIMTFFHASGANAISEWRQLALQRSATIENPSPVPPDPPVVRWDPEDAFQMYSAALTGGEYRTSDKGPQLSDLAMDLADGVCLRWVGGGAVAGDRWEIDTRSDYALSLTMEGGPTRPWASVRQALSAAEGISLVYDAGEDLKFRGGAVALFGCNAPYVTFEMNDADDWVSPPVSISGMLFDTPVSGSSFIRGEKIRQVGGMLQQLTVASLKGNRVTVSESVMQPHMYKSRGTRVWYLSSDAEGIPGHVWRILDNVENAFYLSGVPVEGLQLSAASKVQIFSDRIAVDLSKNASLTASDGFRFLRVRLPGPAYIHDELEPYLRVGRVVYGHLQRMQEPEWGFAVRLVPNVSIAEGGGGQRRATQVGPEREQWSLTWPSGTPEVRDAINPTGDRNVWQRTFNALVAGSVGGLHPMVLMEDGSGLDQAAWLRASGADLSLVRLMGVLDARQEAYYPVEQCGDVAAVIGSFMALGGLSFDEEI